MVSTEVGSLGGRYVPKIRNTEQMRESSISRDHIWAHLLARAFVSIARSELNSPLVLRPKSL